MITPEHGGYRRKLLRATTATAGAFSTRCQARRSTSGHGAGGLSGRSVKPTCGLPALRVSQHARSRPRSALPRCTKPLRSAHEVGPTRRGTNVAQTWHAQRLRRRRCPRSQGQAEQTPSAEWCCCLRPSVAGSESAWRGARRLYCRAMWACSSASGSSMRSPLTSIVTLWRIPVNLKGLA
jgi:hypothetical protein